MPRPLIYETALSARPKKENKKAPADPVPAAVPSNSAPNAPIVKSAPVVQNVPVVQNNEPEDPKTISCIFAKIKGIPTQKNVNIMAVICIIYVLLTSTVYMSNIGNILKFITVTDNKFNNVGTLFTAVLFSVIFIIIQTFINA